MLKRYLPLIVLLPITLPLIFSCGGKSQQRQTQPISPPLYPASQQSQARSYPIGFDQVWEAIIDQFKSTPFQFTNDGGIVRIETDYLPCQSIDRGNDACGYAKNKVRQSISISQPEVGQTRVEYNAALKKGIKLNLVQHGGGNAGTVAILRQAFFEKLDSALAEQGLMVLDQPEAEVGNAGEIDNGDVNASDEYRVLSVSHGNIRLSPSTKGDIITVKKAGDSLRILQQKGNWYQVELDDGGQGWAHKSLFQK